MFRTSKYVEEDKAEYATNLLTWETHYWWEMVIDTLGTKLTCMLTWEQFKVKFEEEYCSTISMKQLEDEYIHPERSRSVQLNTIEFNEKARFAKHQVDTEIRKTDWYMWGLKSQIQEFLQTIPFSIYRQVVEVGQKWEIELKLQELDKGKEKK